MTQQCRAEDLERVRAAYAANGISAELAPFFPDVADRLRMAHLVIARAGASTVAELAIAGRPSILVPLPGAIDDHQSANAASLADAGGAWVMPQRISPRGPDRSPRQLLTPRALAGAHRARSSRGRTHRVLASCRTAVASRRCDHEGAWLVGEGQGSP